MVYQDSLLARTLNLRGIKFTNIHEKIKFPLTFPKLHTIHTKHVINGLSEIITKEIIQVKPEVLKNTGRLPDLV